MEAERGGVCGLYYIVTTNLRNMPPARETAREREKEGVRVRQTVNY